MALLARYELPNGGFGELVPLNSSGTNTIDLDTFEGFGYTIGRRESTKKFLERVANGFVDKGASPEEAAERLKLLFTREIVETTENDTPELAIVPEAIDESAEKKAVRKKGKTVVRHAGFDGFETLQWQEDALCNQTDPEAFFPEKGGSTREAKKVCNGCEVAEKCLEYAMSNDERFGIWGGLSERERRKLKKKREEEAKVTKEALELAS